jgi:hypothetical protein
MIMSVWNRYIQKTINYMTSHKTLKRKYFLFAVHFLLAIGYFSFSLATYAKDVTVFDVRRPLAMENDEVQPKDFYINAGSTDGLKVGMIVTVYRRQTLYDPYQNKSPGDLIVAVGQLKIIHAQDEISVARVEKINDSQKAPTVEFSAVMVGDRVDLSSAK